MERPCTIRVHIDKPHKLHFSTQTQTKHVTCPLGVRVLLFMRYPFPYSLRPWHACQEGYRNQAPQHCRNVHPWRSVGCSVLMQATEKDAHRQEWQPRAPSCSLPRHHTLGALTGSPGKIATWQYQTDFVGQTLDNFLIFADVSTPPEHEMHLEMARVR